MTLEKRTIDVPLGTGLDQGVDPRLSTKLLQATNLVYNRSGALTSRFGASAIGRYNRDIDWNSPNWAQQLFAHGDETVIRIGSEFAHAHVLATGPAGAGDWITAGYVPEAAIEVDASFATSGIVTPRASVDAQTNGTYTVSAWMTSPDGTNARILIDVVENTTGRRVRSGLQVHTYAGTARCVRVVAAAGNTKFWIFWLNAAINAVQGTVYDTATQSASGAVITIANTNNLLLRGGFDATYLGTSSTYAIALVYESTVPRITVSVLNEALTVTSGPFQITDTSTSTTCFGVACGSADPNRIWIGYSKTNPGPADVRLCAVSLTAGVLAMSVASTGLATTSGGGARAVGLCVTGSGQCWIVADADADAWSAEYRAGTGYLAAIPTIKRVQWQSRPFVLSNRVYVLAINKHATHGTHFLMNLGQPGAATQWHRLIGTGLPRQLPGNMDTPVDLTTTARAGICANVVRLYDNTYLTPVVTAGPASDATASGHDWAYRATALRLLFNLDYDTLQFTRNAVNVGPALLIGGGMPTLFDGQATFEAGLPYEPDAHWTSIAAPTGAAGGAMTASASYSYRFVFAHKDANGVLHRSPPSNAVTVTLTAGQNSVNYTMPYLHIGNRELVASPVNPCVVEVYRTLANGATFHLLDVRTNVRGGTHPTILDTTADTTIAANQTLYTTGGAVAHTLPSSAKFVTMHKGAPVLVGTDDGSVWIGIENAGVDGPRFSDSLTIAPFDGGTVIAAASLDNVLVLFKDSSIHYVQGQPPTASGATSISSPQEIHGSLGCVDPRSVVVGPEGVYFQATGGNIWLLTRGLELIPVGWPVIDTLLAGSVVSAEIVAQDQIVRFVVDVGGSASVLNYDYRHGNAREPVWTRATYNDPAATALPTTAGIRGACTWRGKWTFITANGYLYQEDRTRYSDISNATVVGFTSTLQTAHVRLDSVNGWQRTYRVNVLANLAGSTTATLNIYSDFATSTPHPKVFSGISGTLTRLQVHGFEQKASAHSVEIVMQSTSKIVVEGVTFQIGVKGGPVRLPAAQKG